MRQTFRLAFLALFLSAYSVNADAQFGNLLKKVKDKVKDKVEQKIDRATDKISDKIVNSPEDAVKSALSGDGDDADEVVTTKKGKKGSSEPAEEASTTYKNDFKRGDKILFEDTFAGEQMGEFPSKWDIMDGTADVMKIGNQLCICSPVTQDEYGENPSEITPLMKSPRNYLPEVFTIEFDFYVYKDASKNNEFHFFLMNSDDCLTYRHRPFDETTGAEFDVAVKKQNNGGKVDSKGNYTLKPNAWNHFAVSFNKRAVKIYINGKRVLNNPNCEQPKWFYIWTQQRYLGNGVTNKIGTRFTNFMITDGAVDLYERKVSDMTAIEKAIQETGQFVTNNILFETGKADLKPESMEEIQKVADYMKKNPKARFEVQGHTDNQGSDKVNDPLSQQRAESVVKALAGLGVDDFNLKAVGKGSHEPVADNKTAEGRAKNRRVVFVKK